MSSGHGRRRGITVLIVDDDDIAARAVQRELLDAGHAVLRARTAQEALATLQITRTDLILMSLLLPDTDGLILCARLKTRFAVPMIVLASHVSEVDRVLALESGAIACLTKPIDGDELLDRVNALLEPHFFVRAQN